MRTKAERRYRDYIKAKRKADIVHKQGDYWNYISLHQLSKGKIHCSCPMCQLKTNPKYSKSRGPVDNEGRDIYHTNNPRLWARGNRVPQTQHRYGKKNWKVSDIRKIDKLEYME